MSAPPLEPVAPAPAPPIHPRRPPDSLPAVTCSASADGERAMATITADSAADAVAALADLDAHPWAVALVFAGSADALSRTGAGILTHLPAIEVAGCTTAGIVNRQTRVDAAVQITLIGGTGVDAAVASGSLDHGDSRSAGQQAAAAVERLSANHDNTALILLADGLAGDTNQIVRGAYEVAGALVPIVGGCAGDDMAMIATHQLAGGVTMTRSVVGVALSSTGRLGVGVRHGWKPVGSPMTVTAAEGTSILSLDDRPALDAYLDTLDATGSTLSGAELARFCQTRPLGIESRGGHHVRFVRGADLERRSIEFLVAINEGEMVTLMKGDTGTVVAAAGSAVDDALAQLDGPPLGVVAFDCVACRGVITDEELGREIEAIQASLPPGAALAGLYTYGEIARRGGGLGFHNQTMVVLALR